MCCDCSSWHFQDPSKRSHATKFEASSEGNFLGISLQSEYSAYKNLCEFATTTHRDHHSTLASTQRKTGDTGNLFVKPMKQKPKPINLKKGLGVLLNQYTHGTWINQAQPQRKLGWRFTNHQEMFGEKNLTALPNLSHKARYLWHEHRVRRCLVALFFN